MLGLRESRTRRVASGRARPIVTSGSGRAWSPPLLCGLLCPLAVEMREKRRASLRSALPPLGTAPLVLFTSSAMVGFSYHARVRTRTRKRGPAFTPGPPARPRILLARTRLRWVGVGPVAARGGAWLVSVRVDVRVAARQYPSRGGGGLLLGVGHLLHRGALALALSESLAMSLSRSLRVSHSLALFESLALSLVPRRLGRAQLRPQRADGRPPLLPGDNSSLSRSLALSLLVEGGSLPPPLSLSLALSLSLSLPPSLPPSLSLPLSRSPKPLFRSPKPLSLSQISLSNLSLARGGSTSLAAPLGVEWERLV